jgi:hypothetical protein
LSSACKARGAAICKRNVDTYAADADLSDPYKARHLRKLETDLEKAQRDTACFQHQFTTP